LFWNEFYLDVERVPELASCPAARRLMESVGFRKRLSRLRREPLVEYAAQMALKREVLEALSRSFFSKPSARRQAFERYLRKHPHLADYARFRAVREARSGSWTGWPARLRAGELRDSDCPSSVRQYHLYVQWLAHEQMTELSAKANLQEVQLYLDMPLGTHRDGYDAWCFQNLFALAASGGSPPDPVFTQGQDWGFAPIHPQRSREQGHAYIRSYLRHHLRHARMLRFDHVMGLHRLFWVPQGLSASHGAYVSYPAEEIYAMLSIESHHNRAVIIGENLGTVPPEVNRSLKRHGVAGMFVVQYEAHPPPGPPLRRVPENEVASMNTHDMPPFAAFWEGLDIDDRHQLGLIKRGDLAGEHRQRQRICRSLARLLHRQGSSGRPKKTDSAAVLAAILRHLGSSDARWLLLNLEDLWLETGSQNTPGTSTERVNWRRKLRFSLEQLIGKPEWLAILRNLRESRP
jgi:4-alpha-glucanotransferase